MVLNIKVMEQIKIMEVTAIPHARTHTLTRVCICQRKKNPATHVDAEDNLKYLSYQTNTPIFTVSTFNAFANLLLHVSMKLHINRINLKQ